MRALSAVAAALLALTVAACSTEGSRADRSAPPSPTGPSTTTTPDPAPTASPPSEPVTVRIVGDIMLGRGVAARHTDPTATLRGLRPLLRSADVTVGTLESTLSTNGAPTQGGDSFAAPPTVLDGLADAGFDALSLANHVGDYGPVALRETLAAFDDSGIQRFGAGRHRREASRPAVVTRDGTRIAFLGFNAIGETPRATPASVGACPYACLRAPVRSTVRTCAMCCAPCADSIAPPTSSSSCRTGERSTPTDLRRCNARWAVASSTREPTSSSAGTRTGVQDVERHRGAVIAHSLGNFVFDMDFMEQTMAGAVLTATIRDREVASVELTPYRMDAGFTPRRLPAGKRNEVLGPVDTRALRRGR